MYEVIVYLVILHRLNAVYSTLVKSVKMMDLARHEMAIHLEYLYRQYAEAIYRGDDITALTFITGKHEEGGNQVYTIDIMAPQMRYLRSICRQSMTSKYVWQRTKNEIDAARRLLHQVRWLNGIQTISVVGEDAIRQYGSSYMMITMEEDDSLTIDEYMYSDVTDKGPLSSLRRLKGGGFAVTLSDSRITSTDEVGVYRYHKDDVNIELRISKLADLCSFERVFDIDSISIKEKSLVMTVRERGKLY
jgi:hypothetical protein